MTNPKSSKTNRYSSCFPTATKSKYKGSSIFFFRIVYVCYKLFQVLRKPVPEYQFIERLEPHRAVVPLRL